VIRTPCETELAARVCAAKRGAIGRQKDVFLDQAAGGNRDVAREEEILGERDTGISENY